MDLGSKKLMKRTPNMLERGFTPNVHGEMPALEMLCFLPSLVALQLTVVLDRECRTLEPSRSALL